MSRLISHIHGIILFELFNFSFFENLFKLFNTNIILGDKLSFDIKEAFLIFIRGVLMGSADIVPGVSGGTMALITGIYAHLVESISKIKFGFLKPLFKGDFSGFWNQMLEEIDFKFFIPLVLGIGIAFLTLAKVVTYCMDVHTALTYSFFLGLIIASAVILFRKLNEINLKNIIFVLIGAVLTFIFVSLNPIAANHSLIVIFISGMIAICAMILPGISGSFLLLLLGQYEYMLNALHHLQIVDIIVFVVGALIGILGFSKILNYLLKNYEKVTMAFLIGVMLGSLKVPAVVVASSVSLNFSGLLPCLIVAIIAFALIIILETRFDYIE
jgi:putative membrane protein